MHAVYEVFERMAFYGISSNLVLYLTTKLHQGVVPSANNVTNWVGTIWMTPVIGAYIADAHLGRYRTFMAASVIYLCVSLAAGHVFPAAAFPSFVACFLFASFLDGAFLSCPACFQSVWH